MVIYLLIVVSPLPIRSKLQRLPSLLLLLFTGLLLCTKRQMLCRKDRDTISCFIYFLLNHLFSWHMILVIHEWILDYVWFIKGMSNLFWRLLCMFVKGIIQIYWDFLAITLFLYFYKHNLENRITKSTYIKSNRNNRKYFTFLWT